LGTSGLLLVFEKSLNAKENTFWSAGIIINHGILIDNSIFAWHIGLIYWIKINYDRPLG
jgi:hypothetical protein